MTIPENVRDVANKVVGTLTPATLFIVVLFIIHDAAMMYSITSTFGNLQIERIKGITTIIETCTSALVKSRRTEGS